MSRTDVDEPHTPSVQQEQAHKVQFTTDALQHLQGKNTDLIPTTCS